MGSGPGKLAVEAGCSLHRLQFWCPTFWYTSVSVKRRRRITSVYHCVIRNSGLQTERYAGSMCFFKCAQKVLWQG